MQHPVPKNDFDHCPVETFLLVRAALDNQGPRPGHVLDLGCGPARTLYELWIQRPEWSYSGLDRVVKRLEQGREALSRRGAPVVMQFSGVSKQGPALDAKPGQIQLVLGDFRQARQWAHWKNGFDLILMNPPYFAWGEGRLPPDPLRAAARHQVAGGLPDFFEAAGWMLAPGGRMVAIFPGNRERTFREALRGSLLHVSSRQAVQTKIDAKSPDWILFFLQGDDWNGEEYEKEPVRDLNRYLGHDAKTK